MSPCVHAIPHSTDRLGAGPPPTPMYPVKSERAACCFVIISPICSRSKRCSPVVRLRGTCAPSREPAVCSADDLLSHHYRSSRAELLELMSIPLCIRHLSSLLLPPSGCPSPCPTRAYVVHVPAHRRSPAKSAGYYYVQSEPLSPLLSPPPQSCYVHGCRTIRSILFYIRYVYLYVKCYSIPPLPSSLREEELLERLVVHSYE